MVTNIVHIDLYAIKLLEELASRGMALTQVAQQYDANACVTSIRVHRVECIENTKMDCFIEFYIRKHHSTGPSDCAGADFGFQVMGERGAPGMGGGMNMKAALDMCMDMSLKHLKDTYDQQVMLGMAPANAD